MGIRNIGIIEDMICRVKPVPINNPMVQMTLIMATAIAAMTSVSLRKKYSMRRKITSPAKGASRAIWMNMSLPKISSASGRPATK